MILPGSYANGFAPRDGRPLYPQLWRGCVGAWAPCLGPTGLTLRDWSGLGNHGTLTNMDSGTDWVVSRGRYALDFDGSNDYVNCGNISQIQSANAEATILARVYRRSSFGGILTYRNGGGWATQWSGTGDLRVFDGGVGYSSTLNIGTNAWVPVAFLLTGTSATMMIPGAAPQTLTISKAVGGGFVSLGAWDTGSTASPNGMLDDIRLYARLLSLSEIGVYFLRPGIAYEMAPRRRASVAVQFNRRRRLLVGAGS